MMVIDITAVLSFIDHTRVYTYSNESVIDSITAVEYLRGFQPNSNLCCGYTFGH